MIIEALTSWNRHIPKEDMKQVMPGDLLNVHESLGKSLVKLEWAKVIK
jgi:hypothetical protein